MAPLIIEAKGGIFGDLSSKELMSEAPSPPKKESARATRSRRAMDFRLYYSFWGSHRLTRTNREEHTFFLVLYGLTNERTNELRSVP